MWSGICQLLDDVYVSSGVRVNDLHIFAILSCVAR